MEASAKPKTYSPEEVESVLLELGRPPLRQLDGDHGVGIEGEMRTVRLDGAETLPATVTW